MTFCSRSLERKGNYDGNDDKVRFICLLNPSGCHLTTSLRLDQYGRVMLACDKWVKKSKENCRRSSIKKFTENKFLLKSIEHILNDHL